MLIWPILWHTAKEKNHRVRETVVSSAVEHIFQRDCNARSKGNGKQSSGKCKQSKSCSKSDGKGESEESEGIFTRKSKGAKGSRKGKISKSGLSGLEISEIRDQFRNSRICADASHTSYTDNSWCDDGWRYHGWNVDWISVAWH